MSESDNPIYDQIFNPGITNGIEYHPETMELIRNRKKFGVSFNDCFVLGIIDTLARHYGGWNGSVSELAKFLNRSKSRMRQIKSNLIKAKIIILDESQNPPVFKPFWL